MKKYTLNYSTDLTIFKQHPFNRKIKQLSVQKLIKSYDKHGVMCNPILVNDKMQVIDGQHRLEAAKLAKKGIYYINIGKAEHAEIMALNVNQKNWTLWEAIESYSKQGLFAYMQMVKVHEQFPHVPTSCIYRNFAQGDAQIEKGELKKFDYDEAVRLFSQIEKMKFKPNVGLSSFYHAMYEATKLKDFELVEFVEKANRYPLHIKDTPSKHIYYEQIISLWNYNRRTRRIAIELRA